MITEEAELMNNVANTSVEAARLMINIANQKRLYLDKLGIKLDEYSDVDQFRLMINFAKTFDEIEAAVCMSAVLVSDLYKFDPLAESRYENAAGYVIRAYSDDDDDEYSDNDIDRLNEFVDTLMIADQKWLELSDAEAALVEHLWPEPEY